MRLYGFVFFAIFAQAVNPTAVNLDAADVGTTVNDVAAVIAREYMDASVGAELAAYLTRMNAEGQYGPQTADQLAARLTRELVERSGDKHLAVAVVREATATAANASRQEQVRRSNGGVQRVEVLPGNIGYLNLTAFWRIEEARGAIALAMALLSRTDALIIDMRENVGGSPDTVAFLAGHFFARPSVPLFDIVPRAGGRVSYATPATVTGDERRPVFVLTSPRTFSAGEGFAFLLHERGRATVVGERTAGAANPGRPYRINSRFDVTVPNGRIVSAVRGSNWEGAGVLPDVETKADEALAIAHDLAVAVRVQ